MNRDLLKSNYNTLWAELVIAECRRFGIDAFFISPGHRNAPLIAALAAEKDIHKKVGMDERAAAYQALGYVKKTQKPAVLLCTSGTAACNYFPALAEATQELLPLIVITADRPFALVHSGANQVMEQTDLFGRYVKKSLAMPLAGPELMPESVCEHVAMMIQRATALPQGPVHINMPFGEPIGPDGVMRVPEEYRAKAAQVLARRRDVPALGVTPAATRLTSSGMEFVQNAITKAKRPLLLVGRLQESMRDSVYQLAQKMGWPVYFDITSGILAKDNENGLLDPEIPAVRQLLAQYRPDCILQLGRRLVSKWFDELRKQHAPEYHIVVNEIPDTQDPLHQRSLSLAMKESEFAELLQNALPRGETTPETSELLRKLRVVREDMKRLLDERLIFNFPQIAAAMLNGVPKGHLLFLGNSSTIRYFDTWGLSARGTDLDIIANRGVSGIEGHVATTLGYAEAASRPATVVLGDVSLIHDLNSLLELHRGLQPVSVVVINNREGTIFRKLSIAKYPEVVDPFMLTPHPFEFGGIASMARIGYRKVATLADFREALQSGYASGQSHLIECDVTAASDAAFVGSFYEGERQ